MKLKWTLPGLAACASVVLAFWLMKEQGPAASSGNGSSPNAASDNRLQAMHGQLSETGTESSTPPSSTQSGPRDPVAASVQSDVSLNDIPEGEFKSQLVKLSDVARQRALKKVSQNRALLTDVDSIRVDQNGMIYFVCTFNEEARGIVALTEESTNTGPVTASGALVSVSNPPVLHSRPGAQYVLFLDFNGGVIEATAWNTSYGVISWDCLPYDKDGDPATFSSYELSIITQVWERVSEDYASFDVDITTEQPAVWSRYTGHAMITPTTDANGVACPHNGYGGIAYVDVFGDSWYSYDYFGSSYSPAWCIDYGAANVAEVISHELGHNLGLSHDGTSTKSYYSGHVNGGISWGPIMGTGYGRNVSQWSDGEYYDANNLEDDLSIMAAKVGYRPDDHGNNNIDADALALDTNGNFAANGIIETTGDTDVFSFSTTGGDVEIKAAPYRAASDTWGCNLDVVMELYDNNGVLIATNNPTLDTAAVISTNLVAGIYYVHILPTRVGDPLVSPPSGYAVYGSLGQYQLLAVAPTDESGGGGGSGDTGTTVDLRNFVDFEDATLGSWTQSVTDDMDWTRTSGSTPSSSTGPSGAAGGSYYLFTEANGNNNKSAVLESGPMDFSATLPPTLSFDYHMYGSAMGSLSVEVGTGGAIDTVWARSGQQQSSYSAPWETVILDLSSFAGQSNVFIRIHGVVGSNFKSDMALDNLRLGYDFDEDGLPDLWEMQYFGSATGAVATADFDHDGFDNLAEEISGHDPLDPASYFRLDSLTQSGDSNAPVIGWAPVLGRVYGVLWSDNLTNGFTNISGDLPYPAGSYTDTVERTGPQQFYRIEVRNGP